MDSKNIIKILVVMLLVMGYVSLHLFKENRDFKREAGSENERAVKETIAKLKDVYDKDLSYWEAKMKQENGELLLAMYISDLRQLEWYFFSIRDEINYNGDPISRLSKPLRSIGDHLEELKEEGTLNDEKKARLHEDVLLVRTVLGQMRTMADSKRNGWYKEFRDGNSDISNYVKEQIPLE